MPDYRFKFELTNKSIGTLVDQIKKTKVWDLRPEYQRDVVWSDVQKSALIDSIILGIAIPPIIYNYEPESKKFVCIDGQQRLVSINEFSKNRFGVQIEDDLVFYSEIPEEYQEEKDVRVMNKTEQAKFVLRNLVVYEYDNLDYSDQIDIFLRNQHGKPLTPGEKLKSKIQTPDISKNYQQFCDKQYDTIQKFCKRDRRQHLSFIVPLMIIVSDNETEIIPNGKRVDKYLSDLTMDVLQRDIKETDKLIKILFSKHLLNSEAINKKAPVNLIYIMALFLVLNYDLKNIKDDIAELKALRTAFEKTIAWVQTTSSVTANKTKDMTTRIIKTIEIKLAQAKNDKNPKLVKISETDETSQEDNNDDENSGDEVEDEEEGCNDDEEGCNDDENSGDEVEEEVEKVVVQKSKPKIKKVEKKSLSQKQSVKKTELKKKVDQLDDLDEDIELFTEPPKKQKIKRNII
jgi:hypothetical protein